MTVGDYHAHARPEVRALLTLEGPILDVGCAYGLTCAPLAERGVRVVGVEMDAGAASQARQRYTDVHTGSLESFSTGERFAQVVLADVLEHMSDPWSALRRVREELLQPDGRVVISLPNVRYWKVLVDLVFRDRWTYVDAGTLDRTHLRFFTRTETRLLVESAGLHLDDIRPKFELPRYRYLARAAAGRLDGFLAYQWLIVAVASTRG